MDTEFTTYATAQVMVENVSLAQAQNLYEELKDLGVEVIYDDRNISAGVMFSDADLLGVPLRIIVSPRTLERGAVELTARNKSFTFDTAPDAAAGAAKEKIAAMIAEIESRIPARKK